MGKQSRDNFTEKVTKQLSDEVANLCSNPECRILTKSGKSLDVQGITNIGVAAHICAAAPNGPRYDESMTREQRRSADNGIWLCQNCATLIDREPIKYTVSLLHGWKKQARQLAREKLGTPCFNDKISERNSESIYRKNDVEFIQEYMNFAPFTIIPALLNDAPQFIDVEFFLIGDFWSRACDDMPHLCNLRNKELNSMFEKFFTEYHEICNTITGCCQDNDNFISNYCGEYIGNCTYLRLNRELPVNYRIYLEKQMSKKLYFFRITYQLVIEFLRDKYPEISLSQNYN